ncbi:hypothetical protein TA3x_004181 [Tundrisphaera sp. TA3]|uniref:hypothetical protein n=1 Tax=Tundrisphaera sp. TA3 TaxID=3435775 RepID=UPI003EBEAD0D
MRRFKVLALLALVAGTTSGCATATRSGNGLASIRSRPRPEIDAPPQHLVTTTRPDAAASADHAGVFARPDGLSRFFPGLQKKEAPKDAAEAPQVAKTVPKGSWLGRRLRGMGQGTPTSLTYSTAPRTGGNRKLEPGEVSILPVALTLPKDHPRDGEVTTARAETEASDEAEGGSPPADSPATEALTPLEPANPESFSTAAREASPDPAQAPADQPQPAAPPEEPSAQAPAPAQAAPMPEPTLPEPSLPEPTLPEPTLPEPKVETPPVVPEPAIPEPKRPEPAATPAPEPAATPDPAPAPAPEPAPAEAARPSAPDPRPTAAAPASEAAAPAPDPRERPRLPSIRPRPVTSGASPSAGPRKLAPPPVALPAAAAPVIPSKTIPVADRGKSAGTGKPAGQGERAATVVAAKARVQDRHVRAAKVQAEASRALGLPDPTLPSSYYRSDAPPVQGDGTVVETAATVAPVDPAVAQVNGPCPHCGHDPHWRPSLQRFGRRVFGLGEFASPQP